MVMLARLLQDSASKHCLADTDPQRKHLPGPGPIMAGCRFRSEICEPDRDGGKEQHNREDRAGESRVD